ncbi:hypothetical protein AGMMS49579_01360 [Spirochaetia bacterium]|nr:hypothetical protein AGMMS49579_01360 [Spirochaetia bacterium]
MISSSLITGPKPHYEKISNWYINSNICKETQDVHTNPLTKVNIKTCTEELIKQAPLRKYGLKINPTETIMAPYKLTDEQKRPKIFLEKQTLNVQTVIPKVNIQWFQPSKTEKHVILKEKVQIPSYQTYIKPLEQKNTEENPLIYIKPNIMHIEMLNNYKPLPKNSEYNFQPNSNSLRNTVIEFPIQTTKWITKNTDTINPILKEGTIQASMNTNKSYQLSNLSTGTSFNKVNIPLNIEMNANKSFPSKGIQPIINNTITNKFNNRSTFTFQTVPENLVLK